jgi:predicted nucleic acid-binding protein
MNSLDTNVLVYAVSTQEGAREKTARKLLGLASNEGWSVPAQVYGEFYAVMTRRQYMTRKEARAAIDAFSAVMPAMPSTLTAHAAALRLAAEKQVQYWDALIIAVCAEHGVTQLYTEDAPSAVKLLGVRCVSPFETKSR